MIINLSGFNKGILIIFTIPMILTSACSNLNKDKQRKNKDSDSISIDHKAPASETDIGFRNLKLSSPLKKLIKGNITEHDLKLCEAWEFKESNLKGIIQKMEQVGGAEWNTLCYNYPCYYTAEVSNGKEKYKLAINPGSSITLSNNGKSMIFIARKKLKGFIQPCDCCD